MTESLLQHQKQQLAELRSLIRDTSTEEIAVQERIEKNRISAEKSQKQLC